MDTASLQAQTLRQPKFNAKVVKMSEDKILVIPPYGVIEPNFQLELFNVTKSSLPNAENLDGKTVSVDSFKLTGNNNAVVEVEFYLTSGFMGAKESSLSPSNAFMTGGISYEIDNYSAPYLTVKDQEGNTLIFNVLNPTSDPLPDTWKEGNYAYIADMYVSYSAAWDVDPSDREKNARPVGKVLYVFKNKDEVKEWLKTKKEYQTGYNLVGFWVAPTTL